MARQRASYASDDLRVLRWLLAAAHTGAPRLLAEHPELAEELRQVAHAAAELVAGERLT